MHDTKLANYPVPTTEPASTPGSWADLFNLRGRGDRYLLWGALAVGYAMLYWVFQTADPADGISAIALLAGAAITLRHRKSRLGVGLLTAGGATLALFWSIRSIGASWSADTLLQAGIGVLFAVRYGRVLFGASQLPESEESSPATGPLTTARAVRVAAFGCIMTAIIYGGVTALLTFTETGQTIAAFLPWSLDPLWPTELLTSVPWWVVMLADNGLLFVAAIAVLACAPWARAVLTMLSGGYALQWIYLLTIGFEPTGRDMVSIVFWIYAFLLFASRERAGEFRVQKDEDATWTPADQIDVALARVGD